MTTEQIPITPTLVTWARERAGISTEDASKTFKRIVEWEQGTSSPTYAQLEQMANNFKLPIAVFFFPEPPNVPRIEETFRTLPDAELIALPSQVKLLLRKAKALQLNLSDLTRGHNPASRLITRDLTFAPSVNIDRMAADVRTYLDVTVEKQITWADEDAALKEWRHAFFKVGVFVFKDAFKAEEFSGFCLYDEMFPIIYVNNSASKTRQIFTLFHELAHLLFRTSGIDTLSDEYVSHLMGDAQRIEVLCNRFAARLLIPESVISAALRVEGASEATAARLAARLHVSREAVFRRFLDRKLITYQAYENAAARWANERQSGGQGGNYYRTKLSYLGREYVALALRQFHQNRIDETQLAEYLDTKPRNLERLEQCFERGNV